MVVLNMRVDTVITEQITYHQCCRRHRSIESVQRRFGARPLVRVTSPTWAKALNLMRP